MTASSSHRQLFGRLVLVGAPVDAGANVGGSSLGPRALRTTGLARMLDEAGCPVVDRGDLVPAATFDSNSTPSDERAHRVSVVTRWITAFSNEAYELAHDGHLPVFLGGDHSLSMGTVGGIARACTEWDRELFVLWLDAHPDLNTPATSPSGNLHGMALAFLCGVPGFENVMRAPAGAIVNPRNVFLLGVRSVDSGEYDVMRTCGISVTNMRQLREQGVAAPVERIIKTVAEHSGVLHVSLDADFLDPAFAPGVNVPVAGGASYAEADLIVQILSQSGLVTSLDVAEINPLHDPDGRGTHLIARLVASLFDLKSRDCHDRSTRTPRYAHNAAHVH